MGGPLDGLDWSSLELAANPVPGDPGGVRRLAAQLVSQADEVGLRSRLLRSIANGAVSVWEGPAAERFHPALKALPAQLDTLVASYRQAAGALEAYWPVLAGAQEQAVQALWEARAAQAAIGRAGGQVTAAQGQVEAAAGTYNAAVAMALPSLGAAPTPPAAAAAVQAATENAQVAYQACQRQLAQAQAALGVAHQQLAAAKQKAAAARAEGSHGASVLAAALHAAKKLAPHRPHHSWWSSAWHDAASTVSGGVHWVEHHSSAIAAAAAYPLLGPASVIISPVGRRWMHEACHAALPVLDVASGALAITSLGLAAAGFVPGVGEIADAANEGVMVLKTGVDLGRLEGGEADYADLIGDGMGVATLGESRLFTEVGAGRAGGEAGVEDAEPGVAGSAEHGAQPTSNGQPPTPGGGEDEPRGATEVVNGGLGEMVTVNSEDPAAIKLAARIGGRYWVKFADGPDNEFDAVSNEYVAQAKPANYTLGRSFREQAKRTFEVAIQSGRRPYFQFDGTPGPGVIDALQRYANRYGIEPVIDLDPLEDL